MAISLAPSHARGNDEQIGLIWNFIAALMMTLTRSAEHHQIQIKPDLRSYTLVVIPKNLKKYLPGHEAQTPEHGVFNL